MSKAPPKRLAKKPDVLTVNDQHDISQPHTTSGQRSENLKKLYAFPKKGKGPKKVVKK